MALPSSEVTTRRKSVSKLDKIADKIIRTVTIQEQKRFIDQDIQEDNISYEESEKRLIFYGLGTAFVLSLSSLVLIVLTFHQAFGVKDQNIFSAVTMVEDIGHFPIPHVAFMNMWHDGSMLVFKLINQSNFDYAWKFKVPDQSGGTDQTYFMFEDLGNIHVAFSNRKMKMTLIQSPTKHFTLPKSELRQEFIGGHSFRLGNFVMFFGGKQFVNIEGAEYECSSVNNDKNKVKTQIWSMKRKVWINGPYLPLKTGCVDSASGVSINRTHGILFHIFQRWIVGDQTIPDNYNRYIDQDCIDLFVFSVETFEWVVIKKCFIFLGNDVPIDIPKFSCSSYLNKSGKMYASIFSHNLANSANFSLIYRQVVMVLQYFDAWYSEIKIYVVDYPGLNHEVISVQKDDMRNKEWTLFNLRSNIYLAHFYQNTAIFYHLDIKPNNSLFLISLQDLKHPMICGFDLYNHPYEKALPFYS